MPDSLQSEHAKLRWYCHRGMKELDVVLSQYLDTLYAQASSNEQAAFKALLQLEDPVLFSMLLGNQDAKNSQQANLLSTLRLLSSNS